MINPLNLFRRPEFFFRPSQALLRLRRAFGGSPPAHARVRLPWGETIEVQPGETIGGAIWHYGIFDLVVTETIWRLLDSGETALDIGANIGQMTSLMRLRTGPQGRVVAFEPHPKLFGELEAFVQASSSRPGRAHVELHRLALSNRAGDALFETGESWEANRGMGRVAEGATESAAGTFKVKLGTLDELLMPEAQVGVCKIDVEGHELKVFEGAQALFKGRRIRDIIFEDWDAQSGALRTFLRQQGFTIFSLHSSLWRPRLGSTNTHEVKFDLHDGPNYLATLNPDRVRARFAGLGWRVLRS